MSPQDETIRKLYEGELEWIDVEFPWDPVWEENKSYADQFKQYYSLNKPNMPKVPKLMTYLDVTQSEEPKIDHPVRLNYRSMVLQPKKWIIELDTEGLDPINGDECEGHFKITREV
jgi:hypothetical protein